MKDLAKKLNEMEHKYFSERTVGEASGRGYISSSTWRGWTSTPKVQNAPSSTLIAAFDFLIPRLDAFIISNPNFDRNDFDHFHQKEIEAFRNFAFSFSPSTRVHPRTSGTFHGYAYNVYAKVVNLAHTHWCFRRDPVTRKIHYPPERYPNIVHCLHVPFDEKVIKGIRNGYELGQLPNPYFQIPTGGMGAIRSKFEYDRLQAYLRSIVDHVESINFPGNQVSPLSFEAFWQDGV